jgi:hypothetical protein
MSCEGRDVGCGEKDGLSRSGAGSGRSLGTGMDGDDGGHGPQTTTPIYTVSEGGRLPPDMVDGEVGPSSEGGSDMRKKLIFLVQLTMFT